MSKLSPSLADKISARFITSPESIEAAQILHAAQSPTRFDSQQELVSHLVEGSLLNISVIGSRALSIPQGEYMVWLTDAGHTMLVPTTEKSGNGEVYEHSTDAFEVQTRDLLANWNRVERVIAEDFAPSQQQGQPQPGQPQPNEENLQEPEEGDQEEGQAGEFRSTIDASTVDRTPIMRAIQDQGWTVTSLANEVGVDPPAISRILRTPKDVQGDPGGRNPSMGLASKICNVLRIDPTAAFPDIFNQNERYQPRDQQGNSGSGSHSHGKGGDQWTQGAVQESVDLDSAIMLLEANQRYQAICEQLATGPVSFERFWRQMFVPTLLRSTARTTLSIFTEGLLSELQNIPQQQGRDFIVHGPDKDGVHETTKIDRAAYDRAVQKMNAKTLPAIKQAFAKAMTTLKSDLQRAQLNAGADPKIAPHAWKMAQQFYASVVKAGTNWMPQWKAQPKGTGSQYDAAYNQAAAEFRSNNAPVPASAPVGQNPVTQNQIAQNPTIRNPNDDVIDAEYEVKPQNPALAARAQNRALPARA